MIAHLDRLPHQVKEIVQTAAVLGLEFEVQVLSQMLRTDVLAEVHQAEKAKIWSAAAEHRYIFTHGVLRDAVYEMQLRGRLREFHRLAMTAYEYLYAVDLHPYYGRLVYHAHQAEQWEKERHYAALAGKAAAAAGEYDTAVQYLSRALDLTPIEDRDMRYDLLLTREAAHDVHGAREAQAADLAALHDLMTPPAHSEPLAPVWAQRRAVVFCRQAGSVSGGIRTATGSKPDKSGDGAIGRAGAGGPGSP